jgi:2-(3-amino-3-carboxypropyl)histidine synthase
MFGFCLGFADSFLNDVPFILIMKTLFIESKAKILEVSFDTSSLPKRVGLVATIQYIDELPKITEFLKTKCIKAFVGGQVLGCDSSSADKLAKKVDAFLYVGSGEFHPIGVAIRTGKRVFKLHPESMVISEIGQQDIDAIQKKKQGMLAKFHSSKVIGVLLTTKSGQSTVQGGRKRAEQIAEKFPDKKFYYFICDTLDPRETDNFPFIECWLNTMCPRMMEDIKVLNIEDI